MSKIKEYYSSILNLHDDVDDSDYDYNKFTESLKKIARKYFPEGCNICGSENVILADSKIVYKKSYGNIYYCMDCKAYVGVHKNTIADAIINQPLGTLADDKTRKARIKLHSIIDPIYKEGYLSRKQVYHLLSGLMNLPRDKTHIGMFSVKQTEEAIEAIINFSKFLSQITNNQKDE